MNMPQMLLRLQTDNVSGSTTLVELALDILEAFATQAAAQTSHEFVTALETLVAAVLAAQPSMAVMINLAQQALQACPDDLPLTTVRSHCRRRSQRFGVTCVLARRRSARGPWLSCHPRVRY